jgi:hypothetical protein
MEGVLSGSHILPLRDAPRFFPQNPLGSAPRGFFAWGSHKWPVM